MQAEPILDIVRGLSTVASFAIVVEQLKTMYNAFFVSCCNRCRGTGIITCQHCHGSKTLRRRPAFLRVRDGGLVDNPADSYQCYHCGPPTVYDFDPFSPDDEEMALKIQENLKAAIANIWPKPCETKILAGTQACPTCAGNPRVRRLTPDFGKALGLEEGWDWQISRRLGTMYVFPENRPEDRQRLFLEYPAAPPRPFELPEPPRRKKGAQKKEEAAAGGEDGFTVQASTSGNTVDDYILPYASDDD